MELMCSAVWGWPDTTLVEAIDGRLASLEQLTLKEVSVWVLLLKATSVDVELLQLFSTWKNIQFGF